MLCGIVNGHLTSLKNTNKIYKVVKLTMALISVSKISLHSGFFFLVYPSVILRCLCTGRGELAPLWLHTLCKAHLNVFHMKSVPYKSGIHSFNNDIVLMTVLVY